MVTKFRRLYLVSVELRPSSPEEEEEEEGTRMAAPEMEEAEADSSRP